jgi:hypothetical protein
MMINESFQPLISTDEAPSSAQPSRLTVLAEATSARRFTPGAESVPVSSPCAPISMAPSASRLAVHRDGKRVTVIEVRCTCGEVHQIECDY